MSSLADKLQARKQNLKQVSTVITTVDGQKVNFEKTVEGPLP